MKRVRKTINCGNVKYIYNFIAPMYGNHKKRSGKLKGSSEAVKKINEIHAVDYCEAMINTNFSPHDWHIALTYDDEHYNGVDEERALKDRRNFINKLNRRCDKLGIDRRHLKMTEQGVRSKRWHHHFVLPQGIPPALMYECWTFGKIRILNTLYKDRDFRGLAQYFVDKTKGGAKEDDRPRYCHRYSFSRDCVKPIVTYETNLAEKWRDTPRPPVGWAIKPDSLYNSTDGFGYNYQRYTLIKIENALKGAEQMPKEPVLNEAEQLEAYGEWCKYIYSQAEIAEAYGVSERQLQRYFEKFPPRPPRPLLKAKVRRCGKKE